MPGLSWAGRPGANFVGGNKGQPQTGPVNPVMQMLQRANSPEGLNKLAMSELDPRALMPNNPNVRGPDVGQSAVGAALVGTPGANAAIANQSGAAPIGVPGQLPPGQLMQMLALGQGAMQPQAPQQMPQMPSPVNVGAAPHAQFAPPIMPQLPFQQAPTLGMLLRGF